MEDTILEEYDIFCLLVVRDEDWVALDSDGPSVPDVGYATELEPLILEVVGPIRRLL